MSASADWFGFLNVNKPAGWSSRQAVDHVKPLVRPAKIGHAGTLDPLARGVLVLCIGRATRLVPYLHELPKSYRAEFLLGRTSPSDDTESDAEIMENPPVLSLAQIEAALPAFCGRIEQVPPAFSAVKIAGRRAYDLARRGRTPEIRPRPVDVHRIRLLAWDDPRLELEIVCGSGTYIRSIGRDLAVSLGSGAVMSGLVRTGIGPFELDTSVSPDELTADTLREHLLPPQEGLAGMSVVSADDGMLDLLRRGLNCTSPAGINVADGCEVAVVTADQQLVLIAAVTDRGRELKPRHVFAPKSGPPPSGVR
jgi:tRNA pseudouridine55 synthase